MLIATGITCRNKINLFCCSMFMSTYYMVIVNLWHELKHSINVSQCCLILCAGNVELLIVFHLLYVLCY